MTKIKIISNLRILADNIN